MTSSTPAMNSINKVQTPTNNGKALGNKKEAELNFNDLFSSAMGQSAPNAQLNSIESQLRESLFKQDKPKKSSDSNSNAEAAQAAIWAQRNWVQAAPVQLPTQTAPDSSINTIEPKQALNKQSSDAEKVESNNTAPADQAKSPEQNQAASGEQKEAQPSNSNNVEAEQAATQNVPGNANSTVAKEASPDLKPGTTIEQPMSNTVTGETGELVRLPSNQNTATPTNPLAQAAVDKTRPEQKAVVQLRSDTAQAAGTVQTPADLPQANVAGNASSTAAQIAPQIAQQVAQQAQAMGDSIGEEGLKVGQKILAAGNLQSAGSTTGIAAGTNGLTGTVGNAQQALIKTPVNQPGFAKELGQTVQWAIGKNLSTVDIRVNPESFGPLNMRLVQKGQQVQLLIRTQDENSANLLTQSLSGLKEVLAQNGLQLNQVQIQHANTQASSGQQGNQSQAQFDQNRGQGQGGQHSANGGNSSQAEQPVTVAAQSNRKPEGTLDLFA